MEELLEKLTDDVNPLRASSQQASSYDNKEAAEVLNGG